MNNYYYNDYFEIGQQKIVNFNLYHIGLPEDDAVYTLKKVLEELNFDQLIARYSNKGRKGYNPIMMYALIIYANMRGIRSVDKIVELCERDICFMWLAKGERPKRDAFYYFMNDKATNYIMENLHYQFVKILEKEGLITLKSLFIDGTKIEANANRYTFVWRGSINYHLSNLIFSIEKLYERYNKLLVKNGYDGKYNLCKEDMFVIEGMDKVREVIEKNKKRKLSKKKKISNNKIIKISNICPIKLLDLRANLTKIAKGEDISFVSGKGQKKPELQKIYEKVQECGNRIMKYKKSFESMGDDRNSYSKTDVEATFMRMKEDHMLNGQLKPAYNVQIAVENYFIIHTYVSSDRTDYNTLIPIIEKHHEMTGVKLEDTTADSGYCSEKNLLYLKNNGIESYIKLQEHEKKKTKKYYQQIGKHYNMKRIEKADTNGDNKVYYICHDDRELKFIRLETRREKDFLRTYKVYECKDCSGCKYKSECLYNYDEDKDLEKNKVMKINENWEELKKQSEKNILSEKGIKNRQIRSIQTEGHFGDIKENDGIRKFNHRSKKKVYKEMMFYIMGRNLNKYHRFLQGTLKKFEPKTTEKIA
ncbi:IS1182 family transposase [Dethiothermospora halolimnae]|uniref:IS1182 family transposase n=1 Tax=Dethiothermospora halolimnae TaxID=3114390 RepID=UPI003CCC32E6